MQTGFQVGYGIGRVVGILLPPLVVMLTVYGVQYIRTGSQEAARQASASRWTLIAAGVLLLLGVIALVMP